MDAIRSVSAAGTAAVFTVTGIHPIDVVKTRLQVSGAGTVRNYKALGIGGTVSIIAAEEGIPAFWKGIGAAWMREASYTALRIGLYGPIKSAMGITNDSNFFLKFGAGSLAGAIGSFAGNPFDVLKTRLMATEGRGKASVGKAAGELYRAQGVPAFYRGLQANVMRAMVLNGTSMACYDQVKSFIIKLDVIKNSIAIQFCSAFAAGFFMAITVSPFDMVRTRLMNQPPDGKVYKGFLDCTLKIIAKDGPLGLYAGFIPIWARFAPTTTLQLVFFEQLKPLFGIHGKGE